MWCTPFYRYFISGEPIRITLIYKNINSLCIPKSWRNWLRERERKRETDLLRSTPYLEIYTRWWYISASFASSYFFHGRLTQGRLSTRSHRIHRSTRARARNGVTAHCLPLTLLTADWLLSPLELKTSTSNFFWKPTQFLLYLCCPLFTLRHSCTSSFEIHKITCQKKVNM